MIRTIIVAILILFYLVISIPLMFIFWLLEEFTPKAKWWYQVIGMQARPNGGIRSSVCKL